MARPKIHQSHVRSFGASSSHPMLSKIGSRLSSLLSVPVTGQIPLTLPRKFQYSRAVDLNDDGIVVGWVSNEVGGIASEAAVWTGPDAKPVLLNSFLGRRSPFEYLSDAPAINEAGVIVGAGWDGNAGANHKVTSKLDGR